ncbi:hypothetical protein DASC09_061870 [Saccharomycopsis crataegensis]|uniref:Protein PBDC1 homolog n=1 Tax=Saccharomycopsis crataegensis TaxID=43959 RepID=A0AAV5QXL3_9ASCO|nr:hypothetical protein DASC09_061870 [Saccharomycopsis crataegensis]
MSLSNFDAENADNLEDIEKQFAVKAVQQAEVYWNLITKIPGSKLKLTKYDEELYEDLVTDFPEFKDAVYISNIDENELKNHKNKERWRKFCKKWETKIDDYNFGTLLRTSPKNEYDQDGTIFALRLQFYAFEISRNKMGLNDWAVGK